jgi:hypothetical protein
MIAFILNYRPILCSVYLINDPGDRDSSSEVGYISSKEF